MIGTIFALAAGRPLVSAGVTGLALLGTFDLADPNFKEGVCPVPLPKIQPISSSVSGPSGPLFLSELKSKPDKALILTLNIKGIPVPQGPWGRLNCFSKLAEKFDLVAYQEDFLPRPVGNTPRWAPMFNIVGPGLSFESKSSFIDIEAKSYGVCSGWLEGKSDCLADKGLQMITYRGVKIVNTHLDASHRESDKQARYRQIEILSQNLPGSGPLVLVGDLNLRRTDPDDEAHFKSFVEANHFRVVMRPSPKGHDVILARGVDIEPVGVLLAQDARLSDHDGLIAQMKISAPEVQKLALSP